MYVSIYVCMYVCMRQVVEVMPKTAEQLLASPTVAVVV
jgi:hypothetical protein